MVKKRTDFQLLQHGNELRGQKILFGVRCAPVGTLTHNRTGIRGHTAVAIPCRSHRTRAVHLFYLWCIGFAGPLLGYKTRRYSLGCQVEGKADNAHWCNGGPPRLLDALTRIPPAPHFNTASARIDGWNVDVPYCGSVPPPPLHPWEMAW